MRLLGEKGIRASGTVREDRTGKCPLIFSKQLDKQPRGTYDWRYDKDNKITILKWKDNKCVSLATNYDTIEPLCEVQRWIRSRGERTGIPQPRIVANYSTYMGGVDHHDWLLEKHGIAIRGKKWYLCLFIRIIDMAIKGNNSMSIKQFRRDIAISYLKLGIAMRTRKGRPSSAPSSRASVPVDVRFDNKGHIVGKRDKQRRCQYSNCKGKPRTYCTKCNKFSIKDMAFQLDRAWQGITETNINKSWLPLWPEMGEEWEEEDLLPLTEFIKVQSDTVTSDLTEIKDSVSKLNSSLPDGDLEKWAKEHDELYTEELTDSSDVDSDSCSTNLVKHGDAVKSFSICIQWAEQNKKPLHEVLLLHKLKQDAEVQQSQSVR
ncbi:transposase is4 [Holotrichia oblita]|uniref:Transposase is4 n=1 Tax=Holotrichia oblita TaxID=644536 RepID=A0ACB9TYQ0_HOLOL|nr:transposase is4 [Holotrichia oblita]